MVYPFFLFHMLLFGGSGFYMAYADKGPSIFFLYLHGGIAILGYSVFYLAMFGRDEIKWMLINAVLGLFGIYTQIAWILALFGKHIDDYPATCTWYRFCVLCCVPSCCVMLSWISWEHVVIDRKRWNWATSRRRY